MKQSSTLLADLTLPVIEGPGGFAPTNPADGGTRFAAFASSMFGLLTILAGLAFLLYFVLGAINWITSSGEQQKVEGAKNQMTAAAIGLVIVIAAYGIAGVVGAVLGINLLLDNPTQTIEDLSP